MSDTVILSMRGISKSFGGLKALSDVSFDVRQGEIYGIIGPNGSGKTTLINCVTGFVKPDGGRVFFRDDEITRWPPHKVAHVGIARTFQIMRPYYTLPAYKNLIIPLWSPRAKKLGGWRGGGTATGTRWQSISSRRSVSRGIRRCLTSLRPLCRRATRKGWSLRAAWRCGPTSFSATRCSRASP